MRLLHKNQKGFTLIEVLITVAIFVGIGVVTTAAIGQLVQSNRTSNQQTSCPHPASPPSVRLLHIITDSYIVVFLARHNLIGGNPKKRIGFDIPLPYS